MITDAKLREVADSLTTVPGIRAVVLGGSRARGTHHAGSDVDLGLYYDRQTLDLVALQDRAASWNSNGPVEVTAPGSWGPWVDGGGWLTVDNTPVDWILRDVTRVQDQCERAVRGEFSFHSQPGHPLGFLDINYAGEVATCVSLADPTGLVADLKQSLTPYPPALRDAMVNNLWQADFLVQSARKGIPKHDITYVQLCCASALMLCAHAWHAAAGQWATNEKGIVVDVARLDMETHGFAAKASLALACAADSQEALADMPAKTNTLVELTRSSLRPS